MRSPRDAAGSLNYSSSAMWCSQSSQLKSGRRMPVGSTRRVGTQPRNVACILDLDLSACRGGTARHPLAEEGSQCLREVAGGNVLQRALRAPLRSRIGTASWLTAFVARQQEADALAICSEVGNSTTSARESRATESGGGLRRRAIHNGAHENWPHAERDHLRLPSLERHATARDLSDRIARVYES